MSTVDLFGNVTVFTGVGVLLYLFVRCVVSGFYTVDQNERVVLTRFGRAVRLQGTTAQHPMSDHLTADEKQRYNYPLLPVVGPGLHFKFPWERVFKTSIATETMNMAFDPETPSANSNGRILEAVTRDQLNVGLNGQIRFRVNEQNLYAFFFGVKNPIFHVMGYFVSILRERIANYEPQQSSKLLDSSGEEKSAQGIGVTTENISINDLRKNIREINDLMVKECESSGARYGIHLEASLITNITPPDDVESALAAINTAHNNVSSEISLARASADQTIVQSKRSVEIETLKAQAEVEPLLRLAERLQALKKSSPESLQAFVRNVKLDTYIKAKKIVLRVER